MKLILIIFLLLSFIGCQSNYQGFKVGDEIGIVYENKYGDQETIKGKLMFIYENAIIVERPQEKINYRKFRKEVDSSRTIQKVIGKKNILIVLKANQLNEEAIKSNL